jgi:hypothetical protein
MLTLRVVKALVDLRFQAGLFLLCQTGIHVFAPLRSLLLCPTDNLGELLSQGAPTCPIGDRAYDSDPLDALLLQQGIDTIAPHRRNRTKPLTQDGRKLRRYQRRWKVERLFD